MQLLLQLRHCPVTQLWVMWIPFGDAVLYTGDVVCCLCRMSLDHIPFCSSHWAAARESQREKGRAACLFLLFVYIPDNRTSAKTLIVSFLPCKQEQNFKQEKHSYVSEIGSWKISDMTHMKPVLLVHMSWMLTCRYYCQRADEDVIWMSCFWMIECCLLLKWPKSQ